MAFKRIKGSDRGNDELNITTEALAVGELVMYVPGSDKVTAATSSAEIDLLAGIVVKAATATDTKVLVQRIMEGDEYIVDTTNSTDTDDNYDTMALTNSTTIANTGTTVADDTGVVRQKGIVGATTDNLSRIEFVRVSHAD
ncbi:MAG: hypothetical protein KJ954_14405 [Alphaproteobacteria bacterium]|nr:hypothetical protein [Alphaproteobacteria bacterium]